MVFDGELVSLALYALQQLGVMLGVGAETIVLLSYLVALRDGIIEKSEERFAQAVHRVLDVGLALIILSGIGVVLTHAASGEYAILSAPAFLFKWTLIAVLVVCAVMVRRNMFTHGRLEMLAGGTWYALFIVHILAPVTTWVSLMTLYGVWLLGFSLCWYGLTRFIKGAVAATTAPVAVAKPPPPKPAPPPPPPPLHMTPPPALAPAPASVPVTMPPTFFERVLAFFKSASHPSTSHPTPAVVIAPPPKAVTPLVKPPVSPPKVATPPPPPKPIPQPPKPVPPPPPKTTPPLAPKPTFPPPPQNLPTIAHVELSAPPPVQKATPATPKGNEKVVDPDDNPFLPAIRVMPKTKEDVERHHRATVVRFE